MACGWIWLAGSFRLLCSHPPGNTQHPSRQLPSLGPMLTVGARCIHGDGRNRSSIRTADIQGKEGEVSQPQDVFLAGVVAPLPPHLEYRQSLCCWWHCRHVMGDKEQLPCWWDSEICSLRLSWGNCLGFSFIFLIMGFSSSCTQGLCVCVLLLQVSWTGSVTLSLLPP